MVALLKDWTAYQKLSGRYGKLVPACLAVLIVVITSLSLASIRESRASAEKAQQASHARDIRQQGRIDELTSQVKLERDENQHNSEGFRESFAALYKQFSDLQSKVQNQELLKQLHDTKLQLLETQKKLVVPKARIVAFFYSTPYEPIPRLKEITVPLQKDIASVEICFENVTDTIAKNGDFHFVICWDCKYQMVPSGFNKVEGDAEQSRVMKFENLQPKAISNKMTFQFTPPKDVRRVELGFSYSCENCAIEPKQLLYVNIAR